MSRPTRIQYENAFYHVMNRGRGRQIIFPQQRYYNAFLDTIAEAYDRFDALIHAYCLMKNHYHLLVETPRANLDRIMRHINGVYTQRYNRLTKTDGPLFRGRYKAILVDEDAYLLPLGRYIHRNPVEVKGAAPATLSTYPWSSYLAYINQAPAPPWLYREKTYQVLGKKQHFAGYQTYVEAGINEDIKRFYGKGNIQGILGEKAFRDAIIEKREAYDIKGELSQLLSKHMDADTVVNAVASLFNVSDKSIRTRVTGRQPANLPRKIAIYCCHHYSDMPLKAIAEYFGFGHTGSVSGAIQAIKKRVMAGELEVEMNRLEKVFNITK